MIVWLFSSTKPRSIQGRSCCLHHLPPPPIVGSSVSNCFQFPLQVLILYLQRNLIDYMALAFSHLSWWLWSGKHKEPRISNGSSLRSSPDSGLWESDYLKFPLVKGPNVTSSSRKVKRKWHSREERKTDREYDVVLVPSDGGCVSGSESDDSDYSIGWLEPHGPGFQSDDHRENGFAVLVRCYGHSQDDLVEDSKKNVLGAIVNMPDSYSAESKKYME